MIEILHIFELSFDLVKDFFVSRSSDFYCCVFFIAFFLESSHYTAGAKPKLFFLAVKLVEERCRVES